MSITPSRKSPTASFQASYLIRLLETHSSACYSRVGDLYDLQRDGPEVRKVSHANGTIYSTCENKWVCLGKPMPRPKDRSLLVAALIGAATRGSGFCVTHAPCKPNIIIGLRN